MYVRLLIWLFNVLFGVVCVCVMVLFVFLLGGFGLLVDNSVVCCSCLVFIVLNRLGAGCLIVDGLL